MTDLLRRLQSALPAVRAWVDAVLDDHYANSMPVDQAAFRRLAGYFPPSVLQHARVVEVDAVPFPPVSTFGLPEFAAMETRPRAGITFRNVFFVDKTRSEEAIYFHELVHVIQWSTLGISEFLLTYGVGLARFGYEASPLERLAYDLQADFEHGNLAPGIASRVEQHAVQTRDAAAAVFAEHGLSMFSSQSAVGNEPHLR